MEAASAGAWRRRTLLGAGAASAALAFSWSQLGQVQAAAAAAPTTGWGQGIRIRFFAGGTAGDAFASIVYNGAQQAQADLGVAVDYVFSGWDVNMMTDQLREAIAAQPDGIAMMGHPGDDALLPLAQQASDAHILMEYQNVDLPKVRAQFGGGYIGADLTPQGQALGTTAVQKFGLKSGDKAIVFGAWGQPGRFFREEGTAQALEQAGLQVNRIVSPPEAASDPNLLTPILTAAFLKDPDTKLICQAGGQTLSATPSYMGAIGKGPGEVTNIGFDLSPAIIDAFAGGWVQLTSDQQPYLQGYLPILSLVLSKKYGFTSLSYDTGAGFVTPDNYQPVADLAKAGIR
ncbi:MAG: substrate-binding domain-containing protein [Chloroflexi bacterium]|nr:substrate-binding domain-containing protein [Chloroflexota bacterium]